MPLKHRARDHFRDRLEGRDWQHDAVHDRIGANLWPALAGEDMDIDGEVILFNNSPELLPHRVIIASFWEWVVGDEDTTEAHLLDTMELFEVFHRVGHGNIGDRKQARRRIRSVVRRPVVVGTVGVALERVVRVAEQGHTVAAVEDLGADTVEVHILEALDRIPTAGAADRITAPGELLVLLGRNAGVAEAGRVKRAEPLTGEEIPRLPVVLVDQMWRPVAELALHARRPQVRRFEHVGICGKYLTDHPFLPFLLWQSSMAMLAACRRLAAPALRRRSRYRRGSRNSSRPLSARPATVRHAGS